MKAKPVQQHIHELLIKIFAGSAQNEWVSRKGAKDYLEDKNTYAPRPDIAIGPFNLTQDNRHSDIDKICHASSSSKLCQKIISMYEAKYREPFQANPNPRCLLAIEIVFSGSSKHILGDITNASMMGHVGIVVGSPKMAEKIERIYKYTAQLNAVEKAPLGLFSNVICLPTQKFIEILESQTLP